MAHSRTLAEGPLSQGPSDPPIPQSRCLTGGTNARDDDGGARHPDVRLRGLARMHLSRGLLTFA